LGLLVVPHLPFGCLQMSRQKRVAAPVHFPAGAAKKTRLADKLESDDHTSEDDEYADENYENASSDGD
jgi:hypothetical protein